MGPTPRSRCAERALTVADGTSDRFSCRGSIAYLGVESRDNLLGRAPSGSGALAPGFRRAALAPGGHQLDRALERQRLHVVIGAKARVGLAVGDIRPEPAAAHDNRLPANWIGTEFAHGCCRSAPSARLGLG